MKCNKEPGGNSAADGLANFLVPHAAALQKSCRMRNDSRVVSHYHLRPTLSNLDNQAID